jgi:hypothetical protein
VTWSDCPSCVPWWCPSTPDAGAELVLADVGHGLSDEDYQGQNVAGQAVLVRDSGENLAWGEIVARARRHGAAGLITNYLLYQFDEGRTRTDLPEAVQQLRLPPHADNPWTFTVSQEAFERLLQAHHESGGGARVRMEISTRTFEGVSRNVIATLPGSEPGDELWLVAHVTSATKPGANCAAGVAVLLELARALKTASANGEIPPLRRNLHLLFGHETYGTLHLAQTRPELFDNALAAIAVCSLGHDQAITHSALVLGRSPDALPSFVNELFEYVMAQARGELPWAYRPSSGDISYVRWSAKPYTPWSDNATWSGLGVPALLVMSLPDKFFHTQLLDVEKTDRRVLARAGEVIGTVAAFTSCASADDCQRLMLTVAGQIARRASAAGFGAARHDGARAGDAASQVRHVTERGVLALESALRIAGRQSQVPEALLESLKTQLRAFAAHWDMTGDGPRADLDQDHAGMLVKRVGNRSKPHGVPGVTFREIQELVQKMNTVDESIVPESLNLMVDAMWFWSEKPIAISDLSSLIRHEFGFVVGSSILERIAHGLAGAGFVTLVQSASEHGIKPTKEVRDGVA